MTTRLFARSALALAALAAVAATGMAGSTPAEARVFVGFGFAPWWGYPYGYPYPYYPAPPVVYAPSYVPPGPAYGPGPAPAAAPATWYYCDAPAGYYPYVQHCRTEWRPVPATPQNQE